MIVGAVTEMAKVPGRNPVVGKPWWFESISPHH